MLAFLADENFDGKILRGMFRLQPELDVVRVQDIGMTGAKDPVVLERAAAEDRVVLTHDVTTMTYYAYERVRLGRHMPGVVHVSRHISLAQAIEDILLIACCSIEGEWENQVCHLPLR